MNVCSFHLKLNHSAQAGTSTSELIGISNCDNGKRGCWNIAT